MKIGVAIARQKEWHPGERRAPKRWYGRCIDDGQEYLYFLAVKMEGAEVKEEDT